MECSEHRGRDAGRLRSSSACRRQAARLPVVAHQERGLPPDAVGRSAMRLSLFLAVLLGLASVETANADPMPFERGSWAKLSAAHAGQPTVIHFWGLTCAPCLVEMPHWAALKKARPDMRLVLIAADPVPQ